MGPVFLAVGVAALVNAIVFRELGEQFVASYALMFLSGFLTMIAGMAIVLTHNLWVADWRVVITIIGWIAVIGGAWRVICPRSSAAVARRILARTGSLVVGAVIWLALGGLFVFFGYFH
jgi:hypothetical protein